MQVIKDEEEKENYKKKVEGRMFWISGMHAPALTPTANRPLQALAFSTGALESHRLGEPWRSARPQERAVLACLVSSL